MGYYGNFLGGMPHTFQKFVFLDHPTGGVHGESHWTLLTLEVTERSPNVLIHVPSIEASHQAEKRSGQTK